MTDISSRLARRAQIVSMCIFLFMGIVYGLTGSLAVMIAFGLAVQAFLIMYVAVVIVEAISRYGAIQHDDVTQ